MKKIKGNYLKSLKAIHIILIAITFGSLLTIVVLLSLKVTDPALLLSKELDSLIYTLNNIITYYSFLATILIILIYGLFTSWGILKYHWVIIKWLLLFLFTYFYLIDFYPAINGITSLSDGGLHIDSEKTEYLEYLNVAISRGVILVSILIMIFFVSSIKPFGKRKSDFLAEHRYARISIFLIVTLMSILGILGARDINKIRNAQVEEVNLSIIQDGVYKGTFLGGGGTYWVSVEVLDHRIKAIELTTTRKSKFVKFAEPIKNRIIKNQRISVDAITGATTTSKSIMKAVENALINKSE